ncbi:hypothetical protein PanWU01x14_009950 [Parasponia andersonii]|uniref:Uncharacterized protein n=1 Tax=Parasponia andersonii TaxID=3476 RepID=A0A2P5E2K6_PARAD|nr:hypothetical protein PanWU01x14_009950 [Parasponia andersonii]
MEKFLTPTTTLSHLDEVNNPPPTKSIFEPPVINTEKAPTELKSPKKDPSCTCNCCGKEYACDTRRVS